MKSIRVEGTNLQTHTLNNVKINQSTNQSIGLDQPYAISQRISAAIELSRSVDLARQSVCENIEACANWRRTAMNTVVHLVNTYGIKDETAAHAMSLIDRFLAANLGASSARADVDSASDSGIWVKSDCYAIACFLLATKFKNVRSPCIEDLMRIVGTPWPEEVILRCEEEVLSSIGWALHVTTGAATSCHFLPASDIPCPMMFTSIAIFDMKKPEPFKIPQQHQPRHQQSQHHQVAWVARAPHANV